MSYPVFLCGWICLKQNLDHSETDVNFIVQAVNKVLPINLNQDGADRAGVLQDHRADARPAQDPPLRAARAVELQEDQGQEEGHARRGQQASSVAGEKVAP